MLVANRNERATPNVVPASIAHVVKAGPPPEVGEPAQHPALTAGALDAVQREQSASNLGGDRRRVSDANQRGAAANVPVCSAGGNVHVPFRISARGRYRRTV